MLVKYKDSTLFIPDTAFNITFVQSGGPGGQNVNKVATSARLIFNIDECFYLPNDIKSLIIKHLHHKITKNNELNLVCRIFRTQYENKQEILRQAQHLIESALKPKKIRLKTKPKYSSIVERLTDKKYNSIKKQLRKPEEL